MASILTDPFGCDQLISKGKFTGLLYESLAASLLSYLAISLSSSIAMYYSLYKSTQSKSDIDLTSMFNWDTIVHTVCRDTSNMLSSFVTNIGRLVPTINEACYALEDMESKMRDLKYRTLFQIGIGILVKLNIIDQNRNRIPNPELPKEGWIERCKKLTQREICNLAKSIENIVTKMCGTKNAILKLENGEQYKKLKL